MKLKSLVLLAVFAVGCDKAEPAAPQPESTGPKVEQNTPAVEAPEPPKDPAAAADFSTFVEGDWCPRAHADTAKIVEAMKATIKRSGSEIKDESLYEPPERERYVGLCGKLPVDMRKCLVIGYATQNRETCQTTLDGLDEEAKATYAELMGK